MLYQYFTESTLASGFPEDSDTLVLPVVLRCGQSWSFNYNKRSDGTGESVFNSFIFSHMLLCVALEVVFAVNAGHCVGTVGCSIAILSFLLDPLEVFRQECCSHLPRICAAVAVAMNVPIQNSAAYDVENLCAQGVLAFLGVIKSGGIDVDVSFVLICQHTNEQRSWSGDAIKKHLCYIALTRARKRMYNVHANIRILSDIEKSLSWTGFTVKRSYGRQMGNQMSRREYYICIFTMF